MSKKTTSAKSANTTTNDASGKPEVRRTPGDGSRMLSAAELEQEHGADELKANAEEAARVRATNG